MRFLRHLFRRFLEIVLHVAAKLEERYAALADTPPLKLAKAEWRETYHNGSYTTLLMLDFWIKHRNISYVDYLQKPSVILSQQDWLEYNKRVEKLGEEDDKRARDEEFPVTKEWLSTLCNDAYDPIIHHGTGRCTSFAIQTAEALTQNHRDEFDFKYYRAGIHQFARCQKTGIVIDSTSMPFTLPPHSPVSLDPSTDSYSRAWKFLMPDKSMMTRRHQNAEPAEGQWYLTSPNSWRDAIDYCLIDVAIKQQIILLFRTCPPDGKMDHHGMIQWLVQGRLVMRLTKDQGDPGTEIKFGVADAEVESYPGNEEDCKEILAGFVELYGGRNTRNDPEYEKCRDVVNEIWEAGKRLYGPPRLRLIKPDEELVRGKHCTVM